VEKGTEKLEDITDNSPNRRLEAKIKVIRAIKTRRRRRVGFTPV
jgi:hypothetical protein